MHLSPQKSPNHIPYYHTNNVPLCPDLYVIFFIQSASDSLFSSTVSLLNLVEEERLPCAPAMHAPSRDSAKKEQKSVKFPHDTFFTTIRRLKQINSNHKIKIQDFIFFVHLYHLHTYSTPYHK